MVAEDGKCPDEGSAVGMQLCQGNVDLSKKHPLKAIEREALPNAFEYCLVEEKEGFPVVGAVINGNRFTSCTRANGDVGVMFSPERSTFEVRFTIQVIPPVSKGGQGGGFSEEFVRGSRVQRLIINARRRKVGSDFRLCHDERKLRKTKKGRNKVSVRGNYGVK